LLALDFKRCPWQPRFATKKSVDCWGSLFGPGQDEKRRKMGNPGEETRGKRRRIDKWPKAQWLAIFYYMLPH